NAALTHDRRHDNQMAVSLPPEDWQRRACGEIGTEVIDVDELPHLIRPDLVDRARDAEPRVADHDVEPAELLDASSDQPLHGVLVSHVRHDWQRMTPLRLDLA